MEKIRNYFRRFMKEEEGMEFLQVVIIVAIVAGMAVALYALVVQPMMQRLEQAGQAINEITTDVSGGGGGDL